MKVSVSFLCSDYDQEETIKRIDESNTDYIHVDMMDGNFVEASNFGPQEIKKMFKHWLCFLHCMRLGVANNCICLRGHGISLVL